jgi:hypothetical protein
MPFQESTNALLPSFRQHVASILDLSNSDKARLWQLVAVLIDLRYSGNGGADVQQQQPSCEEGTSPRSGRTQEEADGSALPPPPQGPN